MNNQTAVQSSDQQQGGAVAQFRPPRLPFHPQITESFGIQKSEWKALVEAIYPGAQSVDSVIMALSYCKARKLDPFKRPVYIVPIWDRAAGCMVDTVWPGISELRTTAHRTGLFAGRDKTEFGPVKQRQWKDKNGKPVIVEFPEWAQVTVYRMVAGVKVPFEGPQVWWEETYAGDKNDVPNSMWQRRPRGQLDKCAEAAALRAAFPEEMGDDMTDDEVGIIQAKGNVGGIINGEAEEIRPDRQVTAQQQKVVENVFSDLISEWGEVVGAHRTPLAWAGAFCAAVEEAENRAAMYEHNAEALADLEKVRPDLYRDAMQYAPAMPEEEQVDDQKAEEERPDAGATADPVPSAADVTAAYNAIVKNRNLAEFKAARKRYAKLFSRMADDERRKLEDDLDEAQAALEGGNAGDE